MNEYLKAAQDAAREGGRVLMEYYHKAISREKSPKDLVTDADLASQDAIFRLLQKRFPEVDFIGEEDPDAGTFHSEGAVWVVDPLDGTANYVHRMPNFAVSIALVENNQCQCGVVFDPIINEMYSAVVGGGAQLNGESIQVSTCKSLQQALIAASFPPNIQKGAPEIDQFVEVLVQSQSVRRLGSAALNLCYVGAGRLDGYWAHSTKPWDVAAGALIALEAGAFLTAYRGLAFDLWRGDLAIAATEELHRELLNCLWK